MVIYFIFVLFLEECRMEGDGGDGWGIEVNESKIWMNKGKQINCISINNDYTYFSKYFMIW